ncbi:hypothetical protein KDW_42360 [Dictyobacter vulcani]|uniref:Uncharacterized protein n=1 Tax=Dictyobacter vulcani TaxID=2607529 RepID=A0A5J4KKX5_9CHLR|nr:hypothetical protein [Dictyobacter vulcani]GER90074.1 hypothetical protein KDW_42360 [Dictyobacter vulcani]
MGYELTALIGRENLASVPLEYSNACVIPLRHNLQMIPLTIAFWNELGDRHDAGSPRRYEHIGAISISTCIVELAQQLSKQDYVAYVEAGFLGGIGSQQAIVWQEGKVILATTMYDFGAINQALRCFGVQANNPDILDEFMMVGLGRWRYTEHWPESRVAPQSRELLQLLMALAQAEKALRELNPGSSSYQLAEAHKKCIEQQLRDIRHRERK